MLNIIGKSFTRCAIIANILISTEASIASGVGIHHNNINKKLQELLLSHTKQFDNIQDIYDVINYLLDKQIELEEVHETFLDDDDETTLT